MKTKPKIPPAPKGCSAEAAAVWKRLHAEFDLIDAGAVEVLTAGLQAFDTMNSAERTLSTEGLTTLDRYGTPKAHPACDIARSARSQWLQALRMLGLHTADDE